MVAFEFFKQHRGRFAQDVDQHVKPAAVRHANHDLFYTHCARVQHGLVQQRNKAVSAFQGKPFLAHVAGVQEFFQPLGRGQHSQDAQALFIVDLGMPFEPSRRCCSHSRLVVSDRCRYSTPMLPQ